jgi:hypothetical protein
MGKGYNVFILSPLKDYVVRRVEELAGGCNYILRS